MAELRRKGLVGVVIENLGRRAFIERYDRPGTLFYLDLPCWGNEEDYGRGLLDRDQFAALKDRLRRLKGAFVMSINDRPEVRANFEGFELDEAALTYSVSGDKGSPARELIYRSARL